MSDPGKPREKAKDEGERPESEEAKVPWTGFPSRERVPAESLAVPEPERTAPRMEEPEVFQEEERPHPAPPAAFHVDTAPPPEPEFRPIDTRGRSSRRLEDERNIGASEAERPLSYFTRRTGVLDVLFAFLFVAVGYFSVMLTYSGFGHAWDEALYLKSAQRAAEWVQQAMLSGEPFLFSREGIENDWGGRFEGEMHPEIGPVPKLAMGFGYILLPDHGFPPMTAGRLPVAAAFALTLALLYLMGTAEYGRLGGFAAALTYLLMPRVFGHAHIAASETLLAFAAALTTWAFLAGIARWPLAILLTAPAFALALGTKVTALFLPIPLILWGQLYRRRDYGSNVFAMFLIAPLLLAAIWPWLWHDGPAKFLDWLNFYIAHQSTAVFYLGRQWGYGHPNAPWHYPFVITAAVLPLWIAVLGGVGVLRALLQLRARPVSVLFLMLALMFLGVSALPGSPKYDGERLFFPAFLFLALLAGGGFAGLAALARQTALASHRPGTNRQAIIRHQNLGAALVLIGLSIWGGYILLRSHPNQLNYFNSYWVGGAEGADDLGFETSYWGEAVNEEVTQYLTQVVKPGQKVKVLALEQGAFKNLQEWGKLPEDIDFAPEAPPFDWYVLQNRRGFFGNLEKALYARKPVKSFDFEGVPRILVYRGDALPLTAPAAPAPEGAAPAEAPAVPAESGAAETTASDNLTTEPVEEDGATTPALELEPTTGSLESDG